MRIVKIFFALIAGVSLLCLTACGQKTEADNVVTVGIIDGPDAALWTAAQQVAQQKFGLTIKLVTFSDYNMPNEALSDGDIDANAFQHAPFLDAQIQAFHYNLIPIAKTFVYPIALYSKKITSIKQLKAGDQIALPNDPSNESRALLLLQQGGLITLQKDAGVTATVQNIATNPMKLKFTEIDAAQLPRVLQDVTAAVINNDFAQPAGLLASKDGILVENANSPYMNLIVIRPDEKDSVKIKELVESYQSPEVKAAAQKLYGNNAIAGW
jgi:D-methionine transport system substrate-binding protein